MGLKDGNKTNEQGAETLSKFSWVNQDMYENKIILIKEQRRHSEKRNHTRKGLSDKSQKKFNDTVNGLKRLNKLQRRLMGLKDINETKDEDTEVLIESPMENEDLYQVDNIFIEE
uniref:Uncharacterized protein n=1 Tax=Strongyloides venezuelensis TaxID=75913 RepID=A0A0K0FTJ0_STRVS